MAYSTPLGIPPDELAHVSYVRDASEGFVPDYAHGVIGDSQRSNYLSHPPLYYSTLGMMSRVAGLEPFGDYRILRLASALFVALGLFFWLLAARNAGAGAPAAVLATLAVGATPMFAYTAGSINNDTLLYLGIGLFFFGLSREYIARRKDRYAAAAIIAGMVVTFLGKATGSAFIVFFCVSCLFLHRVRVAAVLHDRRLLKIVAVGGSICAVYYAYALIRFGSPLPAPDALYPESPPTRALVPIEFAGRYLAIMWDRLGIVMSHASFVPFASGKGTLAFYGMLLLSAAGWLVARLGAGSRGVPVDLLRASDAFALAFLATVLLHMGVTYKGYLHSGLMGGLQPRYFSFLLPALWLIGFALERRIAPRALFSIALFACATLAFWTSAPFFVVKQATSVERSKAPAPRADAASRSGTPARAGAGSALRGHLDEFRLEGGALTLRGWAFDSRGTGGIRRIRVMRADLPLASLPVDRGRPDVAKALNDPDALESGFEARALDVPEATRACEIQVAGEAGDGTLLWLRRDACEG